MGTTIKIIKDGPAIVEGIEETPVIVLYHEDGRIEQTTKKYAICRCGKSGGQPFCDGSHKKSDG